MYLDKIKPKILSALSDMSGIADINGIFEPMLMDGKVVYVDTAKEEFTVAEINDTNDEGGYVRLFGDVVYLPGTNVGACANDITCLLEMSFAAYSRNRSSSNLLHSCIQAVSRLRFSTDEVSSFETSLKKSSNNPHGIIASEFNILRPQMGIMSMAKVEFSAKYTVLCSTDVVIEKC